jgi:hypothetical protein
MAGPGTPEMGVLVPPRPHDPEARYLQISQQAKYGVAVAIGPAADGHDGTGNGADVFTDRAVPPIGVASLVRERGRDHRLHGLQALHPHRPPLLANDGRVGGARHDREKRRSPLEIAGQLRAAHVMHVIAIAIVGRTQADNGLQRGGPSRRDLQCVEAAPGDAQHADGAVAPALARDPCNRLHRIVLLLLQVFVVNHALRVAGAADIQADAGIAVPGQPRMDLLITLARAVPAPIGGVFEYRRYRS